VKRIVASGVEVLSVSCKGPTKVELVVEKTGGARPISASSDPGPSLEPQAARQAHSAKKESVVGLLMKKKQPILL
jgi:hypothetical protein